MSFRWPQTWKGWLFFFSPAVVTILDSTVRFHGSPVYPTPFGLVYDPIGNLISLALCIAVAWWFTDSKVPFFDLLFNGFMATIIIGVINSSIAFAGCSAFAVLKTVAN